LLAPLSSPRILPTSTMTCMLAQSKDKIKETLI
jgi:hypothetical protein